MLKIVEITWVDATSHSNEWVRRDAPIELLPCRSVGYLVSKNKNEIVLAQSQSEKLGEIYNRFVLPRGCVKNIRELK